jgi:hypothetical protein
MKIELLEKIRLTILGRRVSPDNDRLRVSFIASKDVTMPLEHQNVFRASVEIGFNQMAPPEAEDLVRERAVIAIKRHIYREVNETLHDALEELWKSGLADHPAAKLLDTLLQETER